MELTSDSQNEVDEAEELVALKKVEAALFISARWLTLQELVSFTDINPLLLKELVEKLKDRYGDSSAMEILEKENMWKMDVKPEYRDMINRLATGTAEFSKAEQETLAIIAYKQPVKQSIIIKIRGNKAYEHVKHFIEIGLVRTRKMGHTQELSLSPEFYDYFHVDKSKRVVEGKEETEENELKEETKEEVTEKKEDEKTEEQQEN